MKKPKQSAFFMNDRIQNKKESKTINLVLLWIFKKKWNTIQQEKH